MSIVPPANSETLIENNETMRYRPLGKTGLKVSALSFGCMRLSDDQDINTPLISRAIDLGVNYFETTRGYCGGQCQHRTPAAGELRGGREEPTPGRARPTCPPQRSRLSSTRSDGHPIGRQTHGQPT